jgi:hypothetical protein
LSRYTSGLETETPEQAVMTSNRRTEFAPFVLDLLDFMEEKISEAVADEASRAGAISEAAGVIPLLRDRLSENETAQAQAIFLLDNQMYDADAAKWWADLACMDPAEFAKQADELARLLAVLRHVAVTAFGKA